MAGRRPPTRPVAERRPWDWSSARMADTPAPCTVCGRPTILRHPDDPRRPQHKACEPELSTT